MNVTIYKKIMVIIVIQVGSPSCPTQLAQIPAAPHLALVEVVAEGQAPPQRHPRRGRDRGEYLCCVPVPALTALRYRCATEARDSGEPQIAPAAPTCRLRDTAAHLLRHFGPPAGTARAARPPSALGVRVRGRRSLALELELWSAVSSGAVRGARTTPHTLERTDIQLCIPSICIYVLVK